MLLIRLCAIMLCCIMAAMAQEFWRKPGCHKVGNTRTISIPDCVEFKITTNACRGFCESYAIPYLPWGGAGNILKPPKPVVSVGECCNMMDTEEVSKTQLA